MFKRRIMSCLAVMISVILVFAGCAKKTDANTDHANGKDLSNGEKRKLTILSTTIVEEPDGIVEQQIIDAYMEQNPDVEIEVMSCSANDIMTKLTAMITGNNAPDVFSNFTQYMAGLEDMGALEPLNEYFGQEYIDDLMPAAKAEVVMNDTLYIIPWGTIPTCFIYRTDWLEETGLEPPTTFDEVTEVCKAMTKDNNNDGIIDQYGLALIASNNSSATQRFVPVMRNCGAADLAKDDSGKYYTEINTASGISALDYYYQWANVDKIVPVGAGEIDHKTAINLLATEQAGCVFSGPHTIASAVHQNPELKGKFAAVMMPTLEKGQTSVTSAQVNGVSISATCKDKELAADYIKFLTNAENFKAYNDATYRVPPTRSLQNSTAGDPNFEGFSEALENYYIIENVTYMSDVQAILAEALNACASGANTDPADAAKTAEEKINKIIDKNTK